MKHSTLLLALSASMATVMTAEAKKNTRPNIILMVADDLGFDDMSLRGNKMVNTPHLDNMAKSSISFENYWVTSVSATTRASLLTGRHFLKTGVSGVHAGRDFVNLDETMMGEYFQQAGYKTGMWGKWHSGKTDGYQPWERGFDEAFSATLYHYHNNKGLYNGEVLQTKGWTDAVITDMAIDFIKDNKKKPFFAYVPFLSPHGVWSAPQSYIDRKRAEGQSDEVSILNGQIEHLDDQIGRIFEAVEKEGLSENTIIIFMSDNGPIRSGGKYNVTDQEWKDRNPSQYRGNKGQNFDNGLHSPLFVYWKGKLQPAVNNSLLSVEDLLPTLLDVAKIKKPAHTKAFDGISFKRILDKPSIEDKDRNLYISQFAPFFNFHDATQQSKTLTPSARASIDPSIQMIGMKRGDDKVLLNMWGEDRLAYWNLANDYKETTNLCVKGTEADMKKAEAYKADILDWYDDVLNNNKSYQMPLFLIGKYPMKKSQIVAYGPIELSETLTNDNHELKGFTTPGEFAEYQIDVKTPGGYSVTIQPSWRFKGTATFELYTDTNNKVGEIKLTDKKGSFTWLALLGYEKRVGIRLKEVQGENLELVGLDLIHKK